MEELRNSLARDVNKILELSKALLTEEQLNKLKADLLQRAEAELQAQANTQVMKLNQIVK